MGRTTLAEEFEVFSRLEEGAALCSVRLLVGLAERAAYRDGFGTDDFCWWSWSFLLK
jgi:hypothetical protein